MAQNFQPETYGDVTRQYCITCYYFYWIVTHFKNIRLIMEYHFYTYDQMFNANQIKFNYYTIHIEYHFFLF